MFRMRVKQFVFSCQIFCVTFLGLLTNKKDTYEKASDYPRREQLQNFGLSQMDPAVMVYHVWVNFALYTHETFFSVRIDKHLNKVAALLF